MVSLTNNLAVPFLAKTMGGDSQSPLYLGKGEFNVPAVFVSVLQLCFAGIVAVILNYWAGRKPAASPGPSSAGSQPAASATPPAEFWSPPTPQPQAIPAAPPPPPKPAKPKAPKEVYYNIVGEPINPTEND
jgi:hypothetical protein